MGKPLARHVQAMIAASAGATRPSPAVQAKLAPHVQAAIQAKRPGVPQPGPAVQLASAGVAPHVRAAVARSPGPPAGVAPRTEPLRPVAGRTASTIQRAVTEQVVSGHGRFNEAYLEADPQARRKKLAEFEVPPGITVILYAAPGAALEDRVANAIESGRPPTQADVILKPNDGSQRPRPVPAPYPYVYRHPAKVINYTVGPADGLHVTGTPYTVTAPKSLKDVVDDILATNVGVTTVHYACCGAGYSDKRDFTDLFPYKGWYVDFQ